jgi:hypothetical protein
MIDQEYARKILAALQDAGLVGHGLIERNGGGSTFWMISADGRPPGWFNVWVSPDQDKEYGRAVSVSFTVPKPPISPTAKVLKELQA